MIYGVSDKLRQKCLAKIWWSQMEYVLYTLEGINKSYKNGYLFYHY